MKWFLKFTPFSFTSSSVGSAKLSTVSKILGFPFPYLQLMDMFSLCCFLHHYELIEWFLVQRQQVCVCGYKEYVVGLKLHVISSIGGTSRHTPDFWNTDQ